VEKYKQGGTGKIGHPAQQKLLISLAKRFIKEKKAMGISGD
jgi:hypothetical protein